MRPGSAMCRMAVKSPLPRWGLIRALGGGGGDGMYECPSVARRKEQDPASLTWLGCILVLRLLVPLPTTPPPPSPAPAGGRSRGGHAAGGAWASAGPAAARVSGAHAVIFGFRRCPLRECATLPRGWGSCMCPPPPLFWCSKGSTISTERTVAMTIRGGGDLVREETCLEKFRTPNSGAIFPILFFGHQVQNL